MGAKAYWACVGEDSQRGVRDRRRAPVDVVGVGDGGGRVAVHHGGLYQTVAVPGEVNHHGGGVDGAVVRRLGDEPRGIVRELCLLPVEARHGLLGPAVGVAHGGPVGPLREGLPAEVVVGVDGERRRRRAVGVVGGGDPREQARHVVVAVVHDGFGIIFAILYVRSFSLLIHHFLPEKCPAHTFLQENTNWTVCFDTYFLETFVISSQQQSRYVSIGIIRGSFPWFSFVQLSTIT